VIEVNQPLLLRCGNFRIWTQSGHRCIAAS
jgi:hypothetical protein